ncbi:hypothetical protein, variant [Aphanomyces astaci]|uniref:Palmitoyltransferase n=1 Tax=Aphanomyces astaci TaxID=112090 RepID=W4GEW9_APHAT|nr:hypothetical protein, variant [Aphanomyces astaci]ETV77821.1 hypothetical protein, variant [Aphanomyces astaci]|eukprot:XP_009832931.1 hypothetical protein, variant [Aphanomyces astaci]
MCSASVVVFIVDGVNFALGPLLVCFGLSLLTFLVACFYLCILPLVTTWPWSLGCMGAYLFLQVGLHYILCISTDPGRLTRGHPLSESDEGFDDQSRTDLPVCQYCDVAKPPRTHHCHSCGTCVLDMDHHCVWMHNCIGHFNYRYYWRFLLFTWLACAFVAAASHHSIQAMADGDSEPSYFKACVRLPYVLCLCIGLVVFGLWLWHVYTVLAGVTTLEAVILYRQGLLYHHYSPI